jgi:hypothetical protein
MGFIYISLWSVTSPPSRACGSSLAPKVKATECKVGSAAALARTIPFVVWSLLAYIHNVTPLSLGRHVYNALELSKIPVTFQPPFSVTFLSFSSPQGFRTLNRARHQTECRAVTRTEPLPPSINLSPPGLTRRVPPRYTEPYPNRRAPQTPSPVMRWRRQSVGKQRNDRPEFAIHAFHRGSCHCQCRRHDANAGWDVGQAQRHGCSFIFMNRTNADEGKGEDS